MGPFGTKSGGRAIEGETTVRRRLGRHQIVGFFGATRCRCVGVGWSDGGERTHPPFNLSSNDHSLTPQTRTRPSSNRRNTLYTNFWFLSFPPDPEKRKAHMQRYWTSTPVLENYRHVREKYLCIMYIYTRSSAVQRGCRCV
jgi:hypothetical protein